MEKLPSVKPPGQPSKIWRSIEKVTNDGKSTKFTIQEIPEDRYEDAVKHMCTYFLADEPTCQCLNAKDDPIFVQDVSAIWRLLLTEGISIAAFTENPNGGKPIIAGMNALGVDFKNHKNDLSEYKDSAESRVEFALNSKRRKIFKETAVLDRDNRTWSALLSEDGEQTIAEKNTADSRIAEIQIFKLFGAILALDTGLSRREPAHPCAGWTPLSILDREIQGDTLVWALITYSRFVSLSLIVSRNQDQGEDEPWIIP
ncbi:hypothetical protein EAG_07237 [Camponotus floridanus]|uniref:Uncharacterized protein n=1 Tax=Camponotus floridanus TaxID=104421 RepID=E2AMN4_CAMFO|nr:hypothetical protein EAG_07237 [Camponotus floridanus]